MSREFKFRAYHIKEKIMFYPNVLWFNQPKQGIWINNDGANKLYGYVGEDIALMQYIGMKDTDKKDIYEGDFVLIGMAGNHIERFVVEWWDEDVGFRFVDKDGLGWKVRPDNITKVVGNIYENT